MISSFLDGLKSVGVTPQIDFGNASVGIATLFLAIVTIFIALNSNRLASRHRIAEFRQEWIDDLRKNVALFVGEIAIIQSAIANSVDDKKPDDVNVFRSLAKAWELEYYITLKLNSEETSHRLARQIIENARTSATACHIYISSNSASIDYLKNHGRIMNVYLECIVDIFRYIFKVEWDRLKTELDQPSFVKRMSSRLSNVYKKSSREDIIAEIQRKLNSTLSTVQNR